MSGWIFVDFVKGFSIKVDSKLIVELIVYSDKVQGDVKFQGFCGNFNCDFSGKFFLQNFIKYKGLCIIIQIIYGFKVFKIVFKIVVFFLFIFFMVKFL